VAAIKLQIIVLSLADMDKLAKVISGTLHPGYVIGLSGDLGSGKTTFTKYLAKHMGITSNVNSPTFTLLKTYSGNLPLYHMDVYRLEQGGDGYELEEFIYGDGVAVIEWYQFANGILPKEFLKMDIVISGESSREITIEGCGAYAKVVETIGDRYRN